jgi:hypothetical protein
MKIFLSELEDNYLLQKQLLSRETQDRFSFRSKNISLTSTLSFSITEFETLFGALGNRLCLAHSLKVREMPDRILPRMMSRRSLKTSISEKDSSYDLFQV